MGVAGELSLRAQKTVNLAPLLVALRAQRCRGALRLKGLQYFRAWLERLRMVSPQLLLQRWATSLAGHSGDGDGGDERKDREEKKREEDFEEKKVVAMCALIVWKRCVRWIVWWR